MLKDYQIKRIKEQYPKGTEIELISMEDSQAVPSGTHGIVDFVDDMGTIQMTWDNGSSLGLVVGEDQFKVIKKSKIKELSCSEVKELRDRNYEFLILQGCDGSILSGADAAPYAGLCVRLRYFYESGTGSYRSQRACQLRGISALQGIIV